MGDPTVKDRDSQEPAATEQCCEPECGPTTCEPAETAVEFVEKPVVVAEECCEPECGPDTCGA